jgi:hypothetical protein
VAQFTIARPSFAVGQFIASNFTLLAMSDGSTGTRFSAGLTAPKNLTREGVSLEECARICLLLNSCKGIFYRVDTSFCSFVADTSATMTSTVASFSYIKASQMV